MDEFLAERLYEIQSDVRAIKRVLMVVLPLAMAFLGGMMYGIQCDLDKVLQSPPDITQTQCYPKEAQE